MEIELRTWMTHQEVTMPPGKAALVLGIDGPLLTKISMAGKKKVFKISR